MPGASLTALDALLGTYAGAVAPSGWTAPEGTIALVLGSDVAGVYRKMAPGDYFEAEQVADIAAGKLIRLRAHLRPGTVPAGVSWIFSARLNGVERASHTITREVDRFDIALPIADVLGSVTFGFRLALAGAAGSYEVELPGVYVDALVIDDNATSPVLINRVPEPGESNVPIDADIAVEVVNVQSTDALTQVVIHVDAVLAYDSALGGQQNGFTVQVVQIGGPYDLSFTITPPTPFEGEQLVPVRVVASYTTSGQQYALAEGYSFTTEDVSPPRVLAATAVDRRTVRVVFSENVVQASAAAPSDALNPDNWSFAYVQGDPGIPAVPLLASSVISYDSRTVDITTDVEMTAAVTYRVTAANVDDLYGNAVVPPYDTADFAGYRCIAPEQRRFDLADLLPGMNVAEDLSGDLRKFLACLQEPTNLLLCDIDHWTNIIDPDIAPERFVDVMLIESGNPFSFDLSLTDKRRLTRILVPIYKSKGTDAGIINAIRFFLGIDVTITVPAFAGIWELDMSELGVDTVLGTEDPRSRYTFVVHSPIVLTEEQRKRMTALVDYMKVAHTHFTINEPSPPPAEPDHLELGLSELGVTWILH